MLTWMEQHELPFACMTNLPDRLDPASMRRFLVKVRFDWITPAQACAAFQQFFGMAPPDEIDALSTLTPADFSLVARRAALVHAPMSGQDLMGLLQAECHDRTGAS